MLFRSSSPRSAAASVSVVFLAPLSLSPSLREHAHDAAGVSQLLPAFAMAGSLQCQARIHLASWGSLLSRHSIENMSALFFNCTVLRSRLCRALLLLLQPHEQGTTTTGLPPCLSTVASHLWPCASREPGPAPFPPFTKAGVALSLPPTPPSPAAASVSLSARPLHCRLVYQTSTLVPQALVYFLSCVALRTSPFLSPLTRANTARSQCPLARRPPARKWTA